MSDWWHKRPWRQIQTNLREIDMRDISAARVVADLQSFHANILMINAAGIIASYPTALPYHFQSPYLTGDSLATIIDQCHAADIRVIARTDFSKIRRPIYEQYPQWASRTAAGDIIDYNGDIHACLNGDYQQHFALNILEELFTLLPFDGVFFNMGGYQTRDYSGNYYGPCHCQRCTDLFRDQFGHDLPTHENPADPVVRKYLLFKHQTRLAHEQKVSRFITERWPHLCIANHYQTERGFIRQESNTAIGRPLPRWQYSASENTRWAVSSHPDMVSSNTTVDFIDFPYRHVAVSPHQQALRLLQSLANGGALDYYLIGRLDNHEDRTGFAPIRDIFHFHAKHETIYANLKRRANIALLRGGHANINEYRGWFRTLVEQHHLFDVLDVYATLTRPLDDYRLIIAPDIQALDDALAERLDAFVAAGGTVIVTGRTGLCDGLLEPRHQPALQCLGRVAINRVDENLRAVYFKLTETDHTRMPDWTDCDLVYMFGRYINAQYTPATEPRLRMIPPHPFGPPERCYYQQITDQPGYVTHSFDEGLAITVPWEPGDVFYREGYPNSINFMATLIQYIAGIPPLSGNLPPMVEATILQSPDNARLLVHLVNTAGHFGNTFYAPPTLCDLQLTLPCPHRPQTVHQLRPDHPCPHTWTDSQLTLRIAHLHDFDAIHIVLGP